MKRASLKDIAEALNVSKTLVSLVLNNKAEQWGISEETQKKVIKKAEELNYHPNQMARGLRTGKSNIIGLVVADISNNFYAKISRTIQREVAKLGYQLLVCSSDEVAEKEYKLIELLKDRQRVEGLIVATTQEKTDQFAQLKKEEFPMVFIDRKPAGLPSYYVGVDNYKGAFDMVEHMIELGIRKIGLVNVSPTYISTLRDREEGYKDALKKHGIKLTNSIRAVSYHDIEETTEEAVRSLVTPPNGMEALFVVNNYVAVNCLQAIHKMNLRIPQDIALVCFDDMDAFKFSHPPLTTVAQPLEKIGEEAVKLLLKQINGKNGTPQSKILPTKLVIRKSCGSFLKQGSK
ncbi:MAG TPA: LacI family DNA-binding transcriptional regulator [Bacteroidia bacterium]|nr:LacI family DNA-binding transcriptional regulator [Bacteroidia bacterium]